MNYLMSPNFPLPTPIAIVNITKLCTSKTRDWKRKGKIETERDTLGIPGREVFQTVANQERGGGCRDKGRAVENNTIALGQSPPQKIYTMSLNSSAKIKLPPKRRPREKVTV